MCGLQFDSGWTRSLAAEPCRKLRRAEPLHRSSRGALYALSLAPWAGRTSVLLVCRDPGASDAAGLLRRSRRSGYRSLRLAL